MKFLRNLSLKHLSILAAASVLILLIIEIITVKLHFNSVEEVQTQIDFARSAQLQAQRIELETERQLRSSASLPKILAELNKQEHFLQLIKEGGRIPGGKAFLQPLQRLPLITFEKLQEHFIIYKSQTIEALKPADTTDVEGITLNAQSQWMLVADWYDKLIKDLYDELSDTKTFFGWMAFIFVLVDSILLILIIMGIYDKVIRPLKLIATNTANHQHTRGLPSDEVGFVAEKINEVIEHFRDASDFVKSIGSGKLDIDYKAELDNEYELGKNQLADSLIDMQAKLRNINEEDKRRKWANEGLARFVDILRSSDSDLNKLGDKIISTLVQYTKANQGALYVINDDDQGTKYLDLIALYAFDSKKFQSNRIKPGEGLAGQTYLEKETIYLTEIPEEYIRITSGLGDANPKALLVVPLKVDQDIYGIVELASFNEFKPYEISFVEKLGETIASTLASVKAAQNNRKLLEESKLITESMRSQEEEMRQNMEELTATQEEMQRILKEAQKKEAYLSNLMDATTDAFVAIDKDYTVVMRNNAPLFEQFAKDGIKYESGFNVLSLFNRSEVEYHKSLYNKAFAGDKVEVTKEYYNKKYAVTYSPLKSTTGDIIGAAIFAHDLSDRIELTTQIEELQQQIKDKPTTETPYELQGLEKSLRINLEALKIAREELDKKKS